MIKRADIDPTGLYRYTLLREWGASGRVLFVMCNPSIADGQVDDPTIRRCMRFASDNGFASLSVVNLFAYRATKPEEVFRQGPKACGPDNDIHIVREAARADMVVAAWGENAHFRGRREEVVALLKPRTLRCLGTTKAGAPRHPLYVKGVQQFEVWSPDILKVNA